jgi:hypothetical protein
LILSISEAFIKLLPTVRFGDVALFENRQPVTAAKLINKSLLLIQLPGVIRRRELNQVSE